MKTIGKLSRCIAILLLVTLFMGMVPSECVNLAAAGLAALAEEATARDAAKPASDLTTDDSGWIYQICADGYAEVLGYADASAAELSIPYSLGGAWVTRIGENAFADNVELNSIFIPGSITEIADTAFSGSSTLNVRAYNGASALEFAQKKGFSQENLSEYDFFDDVIDLSELKSAQWSLQSSACLTLSDPWARRIEVGTKLYIPPCKKYASGMPMVATSVTATQTGATVICSALDFTESVESYHAEDVPLYMDLENAVILADGFEIDNDSVSVADAGVSSSGSLTGSIPFKVDHKFKNGWKLTGSFTISNTITASVDYGFFKINKAELSKKTSFALGVKLDFGSSIIDNKYDLMKNVSSSEEEFEFAKVPVVAPNGLFTCYITLGFVISGSGEVELKADWSTTEKYTYADGELTTSKSKSTPKISLNVAAKASAMVECGFVFGLGFGKLSIEFAEISAKAGPEISLSGEVTLYSYEETDDGGEHEILSPGAAFDVNLVLKVSVEIGLLDTKWCAKATIFTGKINVLHLYWDIDGKKWASSKKLTSASAAETVRVRFSAGTSTQLSDQYVAVGAKIEEPIAPTRENYTFLGWTKNIGSTQIWDFDNDTVAGNMTLYAVWENNSTGETETDSPVVTPGTTEEESLEYLKYTKYSTYVEITGYQGSPTALSIPEYIDGLPVTSIADQAFDSCSTLTSIVIPDSVTSMGMYAFYACSSLANVSIGKGVTSIGGCAFSGCTSLTSIVLPDGVTSINHYMFSRCSSLISISIPEGVTSIDNDAFYHCISLESIDIPDSVTSIGNYAFWYCSSLTSVSIPDSMTRIGYSAFRYCSSLESVNIQGNVTNIDDYAFSNCSSLKSVNIGNSVTNMGGFVFNECSSLKSVSIGNSMTNIGGFAFYKCSSLTSINIPDSVTIIGYDAFFRCSSLESVSIPDSVTYIDGEAFSGCSSLQTLSTTHGSYAEEHFKENYPKVQIVYLDDATEDPAGFVYDLSGTSATITDCDDSEMYLNVPAELNGTSVTALAAESIPSGVRRITLPATISSVDAQAFRWAEDLYAITVDEDNPYFYSMDGVLYAENGTLVCYPRAKKADSFTPADGTTAIGDYAFYAADKLGALNLNEGITSIGSRAVYECDKLKALSLPASLEKLGDYAVYGCRALEQINFAADPQSIGGGCFVGCGDELAMLGPVGAKTLEDYADTYLLNYNEYTVTYMMYGEVLAYIDVRAGELLGEPLKPEDGEMSFKGWSQEENGALWDYAGDVMPEADITLYAVWKYDFSYEAASGGVKLLRYTGDKDTIRVPESIDGEAVVEIAEDCFEGLTVTCLIGEKGGVAESFAAKAGLEFEALTHTLSFRSNGGTYVAPRTLCATDAIEAPSIRRSNYTFLGWYLDADCTEVFDLANGMPAADLMLYAGWEKIDANVSDVPFEFSINETGLTITAYTGKNHTVTIPEEINGVAVTEIGARAFDGDQIIFTLNVPDSVTEIGEAAFASSRISEIGLESGLKKIGAYAFDSCYELQSISLPDTVSDIGAYAFQDCLSLLKIELPSALKAIPEGMLAGCGFLEEVKLPAALESISEAAFDDCDSLTNLELDAEVCEVSPDAFDGCEALTEIEVSSANMYYRSVEGVLLSADGSKLICYPQGKKDATYTVPSGVTALGDASMAGSRIEKLVLNEELAYIGAEALKGSRYLAELVISSDSALSMIGGAAFQGCTALEELTLPASLAAIEEGAFDGCMLRSVTFGGDTLLAEEAIPARDALIFYGLHDWDAEDYAKRQGIRYIDLQADIPVTGIELKTELTLERGEIAQLEVVFTPEDSTETALEWSSSDASVVFVDANGAVSGRYIGTAIVTATAKNGSTASCTITVIEPQIKELTLDKTEVSMELGDSVTLTATLSSGASISASWESDDTQIASVEDGVIRALRVGSATITASAYACEAATCRVTVTAPEKLTGGLILPCALTQIRDEAFAGGEFESVTLPEGAESIGARAFADCTELRQITIPASVNSIAADAFDGCDALVIFCAEGSEAEQYAAAHGIPCATEEN